LLVNHRVPVWATLVSTGPRVRATLLRFCGAERRARIGPVGEGTAKRRPQEARVARPASPLVDRNDLPNVRPAWQRAPVHAMRGHQRAQTYAPGVRNDERTIATRQWLSAGRQARSQPMGRCWKYPRRAIYSTVDSRTTLPVVHRFGPSASSVSTVGGRTWRTPPKFGNRLHRLRQ
jgi:hypothetical protein